VKREISDVVTDLYDETTVLGLSWRRRIGVYFNG